MFCSSTINPLKIDLQLGCESSSARHTLLVGSTNIFLFVIRVDAFHLLVRRIGEVDDNLIAELAIDLLKRQVLRLQWMKDQLYSETKTLRRATNLGTPEIQDNNINGGQTDKEHVIFPLDISQRRRSGFDIYQCGEEGADHGPCDTLTTDVSWEYFA